MTATSELPQLDDVGLAAKKLGVSSSYLEKLPRDTPGLHFFGRRRKIDVPALKEWARQAALKKAAEPKRKRTRKAAGTPKDAA